MNGILQGMQCAGTNVQAIGCEFVLCYVTLRNVTLFDSFVERRLRINRVCRACCSWTQLEAYNDQSSSWFLPQPLAKNRELQQEHAERHA
jgi:hypothetical protein